MVIYNVESMIYFSHVSIDCVLTTLSKLKYEGILFPRNNSQNYGLVVTITIGITL